MESRWTGDNWGVSMGSVVIMRFSGTSRHSERHETISQVALWTSTRHSQPLYIRHCPVAHSILQLSKECSQIFLRGRISMIHVDRFNQWTCPWTNAVGRSPCSFSCGIASRISAVSLCCARITKLPPRSAKCTWTCLDSRVQSQQV